VVKVVVLNTVVVDLLVEKVVCVPNVVNVVVLKTVSVDLLVA